MGAAANFPSVCFQRILLLTDFSPCSDKALSTAAAIARRYDAQLLIAHVIASGPQHALPLQPHLNRELVIRNANACAEQLSETGRLAGINTDILLEEGELWSVVAAIIEKRSIDLIVVGTHGRTDLRKLVFGSVAEQIFRRATCPVLTVGPHVASDVLEGGKIRCVLYATDFSENSRHALPYAVSLAQDGRARLVLLHVLEFDPEVAPDLEPRVVDQAILRKTEKQLWDLLPPRTQLLREPEALVEFGFAPDRIVAVAQNRNADVIVMGVHHSTSASLLSRLPWSTAHNVPLRATCPVLTVR